MTPTPEALEEILNEPALYSRYAMATEIYRLREALVEQAQAHPDCHPAALCDGPEQARLEDQCVRQAQEIERLRNALDSARVGFALVRGFVNTADPYPFGEQRRVLTILDKNLATIDAARAAQGGRGGMSEKLVGRGETAYTASAPSTTEIQADQLTHSRACSVRDELVRFLTLGLPYTYTWTVAEIKARAAVQGGTHG